MHLNHYEKHQYPPEDKGQSSPPGTMLSGTGDNFASVRPKNGFLCQLLGCEHLGLPFTQDLWDAWYNVFPRKWCLGEAQGRAAALLLNLSNGRRKVNRGEKSLHPSILYVLPKHNPKSFLF